MAKEGSRKHKKNLTLMLSAQGWDFGLAIFSSCTVCCVHVQAFGAIESYRSVRI